MKIFEVLKNFLVKKKTIFLRRFLGSRKSPHTQNSSVDVIFDAQQDGRKMFQNFEKFCHSGVGIQDEAPNFRVDDFSKPWFSDPIFEVQNFRSLQFQSSILNFKFFIAWFFVRKKLQLRILGILIFETTFSKQFFRLLKFLTSF